MTTCRRMRGNLDIMTAAATKVGEEIAKERASAGTGAMSRAIDDAERGTSDEEEWRHEH